VAVASTRGDGVLIEHAFCIPLRSRQPGTEREEVDVGSRIASALTARGLGHLDALVAVGRTNIELRQLLLPPAPDDELPEMVRIQAMREFNELDEDWLLDFVPIDEAPGGPRTVLAAAVGPELVDQIQEVCHTAHLRIRRLGLRACAAASLLARAKAGQSGQLRLLVDLLGDEADLTAMIDGKVIFLRTTRTSGDSPQPASLLAEIRRTMAAVHNQLGTRRVDTVVFCGQGEAHANLARLAEDELGTPAELFDPFAGLKLADAVERERADHPGRFAPLLGMLLAELEQTGHAVDFLHPRRKPQPPSRRRKYILAGVVAVLLAAIYPIHGRIQRGRLAYEVDQLQEQSQALDRAVTQADKVRSAVAEITKWGETDVVWLEQLRTLSLDFLPAERTALRQLTFGPAPHGGEIRLRGMARKAETIAAMEEALRSRSRRVVGRDSREETSPLPYGWQFETSLFVDREPP